MAEKEATRATRVQESYRQLSVAANTLNTASDALSESIATLDVFLRNLGLGISGWVTFSEWKSEDELQYSRERVGYAKSGRHWGLSIQIHSGHDALNEEHTEQWPFNEAPRNLRLRAVAKIPDLLDQLNKDALSAAKIIAEKAAEVDQLTAAMTAIASGEAKR